ncbi:cation:proton antiporter domain-containing protein [Kitasatospora saccharophila]|uniref:cation:proton antiporter domain-containing protein n=1 Tax=Kitasatospora saccharophila TaxID=407973 RepID=UPI003CD07ABD
MLVAVFGAALLVAVLLSGLAARTVLSTSLLFLAAGALVGDGLLGLIHVTPNSPVVAATADLALFAVLFTDGMHVALPALRAAWRNPARALGLGMPLAFAGMALVAHLLVGLDWTTSFLVGAVLAPTDPVFASAIVGRREVPARLRQLLNVESGLHDGLALPVVLVLIAAAGPASSRFEASLPTIGLELVGGLSWGGYAAVALAIVLIRPASLLLSLIRSRIDRREQLVAAWFGPKGFASVVYGLLVLLVLQAGIPQGERAHTLIAVCIAASIVVHSSTDVPVARLFHVDRPEPGAVPLPARPRTRTLTPEAPDARA